MLENKGVRIRSESEPDPIRPDRVRIGFVLDLSNSDWIGSDFIVFYSDRIGSDQAIFF